MNEINKKFDLVAKTLIEVYNELPDYVESLSTLDPVLVRSRSTLGDIIFVLRDIQEKVNRILISSDDDTEGTKEGN